MKKYGLWLSQIKGMTSAKITYLMQYFSGAEEIYGASKEQLLKCPGLDASFVEQIVFSKNCDLQQRLMELEQEGISFVCQEESAYPKRLSNIANAPYGLYYKGCLPMKDKNVAIVGARGRSAYGAQIARILAKELARRKVGVISGLALGIDADAHQGALDEAGATYAVLGCGIDICYPKQNKFIYDRILEKGGIISEYPKGIEPKPYLFPARNRIIAGLSDCLVVVEAKEKSGSLITADFAMEQGKDVYAVPGRITDALSSGTNQLIKQGANVLYSIEDFLKEWDLLSVGNGIQMDFRKNTLEKDELLVYSVLDFCPVGIGSLMEQTSLPLMTILDILERLKKKGFIKEVVPNFFVQTV